MPRLHFTDATVRDLPAPAVRTDYFDDVVTGLVLRVTPRGRKVWGLVCKVRGTTRRIVLDGYPKLLLADARKAARAALLERAKGDDPTAARQGKRHALTFDALADLYLDRYAKVRKKSWRQDARQLRVFCRGRWRHKLAGEVSRADVRELLAEVTARRSLVIANRLRACLSKVFTWAAAEGYLEASPVAGLPKAGREAPRERVLSDDELRQVWADVAAAEARYLATPPRTKYPDTALSPTLALWVRLRILTGQRGGELAALRWSDVDFTRTLWEVPGARFKSGRGHVVPFSPWVERLLVARRAERPDDDYVLEGGRGVAARAGIGPAFTVRDFQPHDLRRTCATGLARLGVPRFLIARVLGHTDASVTGIYDRFEYLDEKRDALTKWAAHVARVVGA